MAGIVSSIDRRHVHYTLPSALKATGLDKVTLLRALESGRIAGARDLFEEWQIEHAELHRVFPPVAERNGQPDSKPRGAGAAATLEAEIAAVVREAGDRLRATPDAGKTAGATPRLNPASASGSSPIEQIGTAVPADASVWDHHGAGSRDGEPRMRLTLTTGAILAALALGWIGGKGSLDFLAGDRGSISIKHTAGSPDPFLVPESEIGCLTRYGTLADATAKTPNPRKVKPLTAGRPEGQPVSSPAAAQSSDALKNLTKSRPHPVPESRPTTIPGWTVLELVGGTVVLEGPDGILTANRGDTVPGLGRVDSIVRWGSRLIVATSRGLISTQ